MISLHPRKARDNNTRLRDDEQDTLTRRRIMPLGHKKGKCRVPFGRLHPPMLTCDDWPSMRRHIFPLGFLSCKEAGRRAARTLS